MTLTCKVGTHYRLVKGLLDLGVLRRDIFLLYDPIDILIQFAGLKDLDEFKEKWFNAVKMIGIEESLITKIMTFITIFGSPSIAEEPFAFIFLGTQIQDL